MLKFDTRCYIGLFLGEFQWFRHLISKVFEELLHVRKASHVKLFLPVTYVLHFK